MSRWLFKGFVRLLQGFQHPIASPQFTLSVLLFIAASLVLFEFRSDRIPLDRDSQYLAQAVDRYEYFQTGGMTWQKFNAPRMREKDAFAHLRFLGPWMLGFVFRVFGPASNRLIWMNIFLVVFTAILLKRTFTQTGNRNQGDTAAMLLLLSPLTLLGAQSYSNEIFLMPLITLVYCMQKNPGFSDSRFSEVRLASLLLVGTLFRIDFMLLVAPVFLIYVRGTRRLERLAFLFVTTSFLAGSFFLIWKLLGYDAMGQVFGDSERFVRHNFLPNFSLWIWPVAMMQELMLGSVFCCTPTAFKSIVRSFKGLGSRDVEWYWLGGIVLCRVFTADYHISYLFQTMPFWAIMATRSIGDNKKWDRLYRVIAMSVFSVFAVGFAVWFQWNITTLSSDSRCSRPVRDFAVRLSAHLKWNHSVKVRAELDRTLQRLVTESEKGVTACVVPNDENDDIMHTYWLYLVYRNAAEYNNHADILMIRDFSGSTEHIFQQKAKHAKCDFLIAERPAENESQSPIDFRGNRYQYVRGYDARYVMPPQLFSEPRFFREFKDYACGTDVIRHRRINLYRK